MGERIFNGLDNCLVDLRLFPFHLNVDLLAAPQRHVPHRTRKLTPDVANGLHTRLHDLFLQLGRNQVHALRNRLQAGIFHGIRKLQQLVAGQDQFAYLRHQLVQQIDADTNGFGRCIALFRFQNRLPNCFRNNTFDLRGLRHDRNFADAWAFFRFCRGHHFCLLFRDFGRNWTPNRRQIGVLCRISRLPGPHLRLLSVCAGWLHFGRKGNNLGGLLQRHHGVGCIWNQQACQRLPQFRIILFTVLAGGLNFLQHLAHCIHHAQQGSRKLWIQRELPIAQAREQVFSNVGHFFQLAETEKSAGALNRVDRPKYARQGFFVAGVLLQTDQVAVQAVQILGTLDQKVLDDVAVAHRFPLICTSFEKGTDSRRIEPADC